MAANGGVVREQLGVIAVVPSLSDEQRRFVRTVRDLAQCEFRPRALQYMSRLGLGEHFFAGDVEAAWHHQLEPSRLTLAQLRVNPVGMKVDLSTHY